MKNYTIDSLPEGYREFLLSFHYNNQRLISARRKADEAIELAKHRNAACLNLKILEDDLIRKSLQYFGTKEAVDEEYNRNVCSIATIKQKLDDEDNLSLDIALHACMFAIDLLDTNLRITNSKVKKAVGNDFELAQFDAITETLAPVNEMLSQFHDEKPMKYQETFADEAERIGDYINSRMGVFMRRIGKIYSKQSFE